MQLSPALKNAEVGFLAVPHIILPRRCLQAQRSNRGLIKTIRTIAQQSPLAFYKGFGPVFTGIIPKMGIRFTSFESYKSMLSKTEFARNEAGRLTNQGTFLGMNTHRRSLLHLFLVDSGKLIMYMLTDNVTFQLVWPPVSQKP